MTKLDIDQLHRLIDHAGVAFRIRQRLQPAGGPGDKVFPPTYSTGENTLRYATEARRVDGAAVDAVLLDSVASQANRMEEALLAAWQQRKLDFPVIGVAFDDPALADLGTITALQAPHRIADAILRDATSGDGKTLFRDLPEGRAYTDASPRNATAVYKLCPTALIFGVWDSTGPKGGMGAKFGRVVSSEIVAIGAAPGSKVGSRIDPLAIQASVPVYHRKDDESDWTIDRDEAKQEKVKPDAGKPGKQEAGRQEQSKPVLFSRRGAEGKGKASAVNHSNIAPTIDTLAGGITFDYAMHTVVLSLPALRKLRFATGLDGKPLAARDAAERAARVALAALALAAIVHQRAQGYDLRSRCLLVPEGAMALEIVRPDGTVEPVELGVDAANELVASADRTARAAGLGWDREPLALKAAPKLIALIKKSRAEAMTGAGGDED